MCALFFSGVGLPWSCPHLRAPPLAWHPSYVSGSHPLLPVLIPTCLLTILLQDCKGAGPSPPLRLPWTHPLTRSTKDLVRLGGLCCTGVSAGMRNHTGWCWKLELVHIHKRNEWFSSLVQENNLPLSFLLPCPPSLPRSKKANKFAHTLPR